MKHRIMVLEAETVTRHRTAIVEVEATSLDEARVIVNEMIESEPDKLPADEHWQEHADSGGLVNVEYSIVFG